MKSMINPFKKEKKLDHYEISLDIVEHSMISTCFNGKKKCHVMVHIKGVKDVKSVSERERESVCVCARKRDHIRMM